MINGIEGIPGSGKSYEALVYHILPALKDGRKVITNLPLELDYIALLNPDYRDLIEVRTKPLPILGKWDATDIAEREAFQLFEDGRKVQPSDEVPTFGHVWDFYSTWRNSKGQGPLFVIDECHVSFPNRKDGVTPKQVIQWYKLSRHFGADVLLMTQTFRDVESSITSLMAILVKVRKADIIGQSGYIRKVHSGYRGAMISNETREYKKEYFGFYRSHTQGQSVTEAGATDSKSMLKTFNRLKWFVIAIAVIFCIYAFWPNTDRNAFGAKKAQPQSQPQPQSMVARIQQHQAEELPKIEFDKPAPAPEPEKKEEPRQGGVYDDYNLHIQGMLNMADRQLVAFVVSKDNRKIFDITSDDLEKSGYSFEAQGHCAGWLTRNNVRKAIACDAPQSSAGTNNKPILIDSTGRRSDN